jgi:hypothetical protein
MMRGRTIWAMIAATLPMAANAQLPYLDDPNPDQPAQLRGKPSVDLMPGLRRGGLGYPLRYPNVVRGTVRVELGGQPLTEGSDFTLDYSGGVLYIMVPVRDSDSIRVSYRHDPEAPAPQGSGASLPLLTLNFGNSQMTMLLGMGGANRFADGRIMQSQNLGLKNNFQMGAVGVSGLFLVSSQANALVTADGASPDTTARTNGVEGTGLLIRQHAEAGLGGGINLSADYQNVGTKFGAFSMLQGTGMEDAAKQLEKEKGLTRMGFGLNGGSPKGVSFTNSFRSIDDKGAQIQFHDYAIKTSLLDLHYSARTIDPRFSRFGDIAEADRAQLQKERGIDRRSFGGALRFAGGALSFDQSGIVQQDDAGIFRQGLSWDSPWLKASYRTQKVDQGFIRSGDLAEGERGQWGKERGFQRTDLGFAIPKGKDSTLASFWSKDIQFDGKAYRATAFDYNGPKFGVSMWRRSSDPAFVRIGDITPQERDLFASQVLGMYGTGANVTDGDRNWLSHENGLRRDFLRLSAEPGKNTKIALKTFGIADPSGQVRNDSLDFSHGGWNFGYRRMNIASGFTRMIDLLEPERKFYGSQIGFDRTDFALSGKLGKHELGFTSLNVSSLQGDANRFTAHLKGAGYELDGAIRSVASGFSRAADINDPEKDILAQMAGYNQYDLRLKADAFKHFKVNASIYDSSNGQDDKRRFKNYLDLLYAPDAKTQIGLRFSNHKLSGVSDSLFENDLMGISAIRDFGKLGKLTTLRETEHYGGVDADKPSRETNSLKYELKLSEKTSFSTEQTLTEFADGGYERIQGYNFGWAVNKKLTLNIGQMSVDRDGAKPDAKTMVYGFSYDIGNNMRLGYNWQRDLDTVAGGKHRSNWDLTEGTFGGFTFAGSLAEKGNDGQASSANTKFGVSNPKPFNLGFFKDVKIAFGYDSQTNLGAYERENEKFDISGSIAGSEIGLSYTQVILPGQHRAADRGIRFKLDPSGKNPLQANLACKLRTMPGGVETMIRDYNISYKLGDKFSLTHTTDNFREQAQGGAPLGTVTAPIEKRSWAINYIPTKATSYRFAFEDLAHLQQHTLVRRTNVTVSLFNDTGSPLKLTYGVQQDETPTTGRHTRFQYELGFDQKPGPNQTLSLLMGTVNWEHSIINGQYESGLTLRLDYQLRF